MKTRMKTGRYMQNVYPFSKFPVSPSVCPSARPSYLFTLWLCSHHRIIMKFSGVITIDGSIVHAKDQGQRSKVKVTEVKTQFSRNCNSSLNSHMVMKWCTKLDVASERWPIVFQGLPSNFKLTRLENRRFWPKFVVSGLKLKFQFINGYKMIYKA